MNPSVQTFSPRFKLSSLSIPDELVFEIFSRLPLKSIARCRGVSKLWSSMLRSQDFTEFFLTKSSARPQLLFVIEANREIVFFSSPQPENPEKNSYVVAANHLARFPRAYGFSAPTRGGFFCYNVEHIFEGMKVPVFVPVICNPSTGQSLTLPRLKPAIRQGADNYLGHDPVSKDFKVLSMDGEFVSGAWISVKHQVMTLGTNNSSWRFVECCIPHLSSRDWMCISGVLYYAAAANSSSGRTMVACFDLRSEKFSFVNFSRAMPGSTALVNYSGQLGLLMAGDSGDIGDQASKSLELWVLRDAGKNEWSKHVYILPTPLWKDVVARNMRIAGMVGVNEIVLAPWVEIVPSYVIYFNVERNTITKVGIQGMEGFKGKRLNTYINYVENVKLI